MKGSLLAALLLTASTAALANSVIVTDTQGWKSVPIVVNSESKTFTVQGAAPTGDFYYSYSGYRCFKEKREIVGIDALVFHAGVPTGTAIYCYAE